MPKQKPVRRDNLSGVIKPIGERVSSLERAVLAITPGGGGGGSYTAGSGLTESPAGTLNVGEGYGLDVTADGIGIDPTEVNLNEWATPDANIAMGGFKFTGLAAGSASGESVIYEQIQNLQPLDATLTALAGLNTTAGIVSQTGTDTFTKRTITGTTNRISVTNGSGAAGDPTLDISSAYVGQASITTLGTIATGTWNGSVIGATYIDTAIARLASPTFTGIPVAPTAAVDTNTTQLATTAYVVGQASATNPLMNGTVAIGTSLRYSRQDHVHPTDTSRQAADATLTALAAYNTNGLLTQTAADTFTGRTIIGTTNRLTVTNGDGVSGDPSLDISSAYVGQTSITTLGTITTGTWNATEIARGKIPSAIAYEDEANTFTGGTQTIQSQDLVVNRSVGATDVNKIRFGTWGHLQDRQVGADTNSVNSYRTMLLRNAYVSNQTSNTYSQSNAFGRKVRVELGDTNIFQVSYRAGAGGVTETWDDTGWTDAITISNAGLLTALSGLTISAGPVTFPENIWINSTGSEGRLYFSDGGPTYLKSPSSSVILRTGEDSNTYTFAISGASFTKSLAMGTNKITGLAAATANGEAVRFEQLFVSSSNKITDSSFEGNAATITANWTSTNGTFEGSTDVEARYGQRVGKLTASGSTAAYVETTNFITAIRPSTAHTVSAWARGDATTTNNWYVRVQYYTSSDVATGAAVDSTPAALSTTWQRSYVSSTTPADAAKAKVSIRFSTNTAGKIMYVDGAQLEEGDIPSAFMPKPNEILPETVGTEELEIGAVTAAKIGANQVQAHHLEANLILTNNIIAGTLGGARVEMDSDGINSYNSSGANLFTLSSATGLATFKSALAGARLELDSTGLTIFDSNSNDVVVLKTNTGLDLLAGTSDPYITERTIRWLHQADDSPIGQIGAVSYTDTTTNSFEFRAEARNTGEVVSATIISADPADAGISGSISISRDKGAGAADQFIELVLPNDAGGFITKYLLRGDETSDFLMNSNAAGNGLGISAGVLSVNTGTGLGIVSDAVAITDAELTAIASLTSAADRVPYFTGSGTAALATLNAAGREIIATAGTANTFPYFSAANTVTLQSITAAGRALANIFVGGANSLPYFTSTTAVDTTGLTAFARTLLDDADATTARATLAAAGTGVANTFTDNQIIDLATDEVGLKILRGTDTSPTSDIFQVRNAADSSSLVRVTATGKIFGVGLDAGSQLITNVLTPSASTDAATRGFVEGNFASPTQTINAGDTASAGTATTATRSDHQHAVATGIAGTIAPDDTALEGTSTSLARADHRHAITTAAASAISGANSEGSATNFARSDHDHALPTWGSYFGTPPPVDALASEAVSVANRMYYVQVWVSHRVALTGIVYRVRGTSAGSVRSAMYNTTGAIVAERTTNKTVAAINTNDFVDFDAPVTLNPGVYFLALIFNNTTHTFQAATFFAPSGRQTEAAFDAPASITIPTTPSTSPMPLMSTYGTGGGGV